MRPPKRFVLPSFFRWRLLVLIFLSVIYTMVDPKGGRCQPNTMDEFFLDLTRWYSTTVESPHKYELIVCSPPFVLSTGLLRGDPESRGELSLLLDTAPKLSSTFSSSGHTTYYVYMTILQNRAPASQSLSCSDKARLARAEKVLLKHYCLLTRFYWRVTGSDVPREPSRKYLRYNEYSRRYAEIQTRLAGETDRSTRAEFEAELRDVERDWTRKGARKAVSQALSDFDDISRANPETFWSDAYEQYLANAPEIGNEDHPITTADPNPIHWGDEAGWSDWRFGNSSAQIRYVNIVRPWLNAGVFDNHPWAWAPGVYENSHLVISDGLGLGSFVADKEMMPLLPERIILARKIMVAGQQITLDGPVVAGMICRVVPKAP